MTTVPAAPPHPLRAAESHLAKQDPVMSRLIRRHGPCTLGRRRREPFHTLCTSIISQQLSTRAAEAIQARVAAHLQAGPRFRPEHFLDADHEALRACGLSNAKARWLCAIAQRVNGGEFTFSVLRKMNDEAAIQALSTLPGVGRWTAEMLLIFALRRLDVFAMGDVGLRRTVNRLYGGGAPLSDQQVTPIVARWAPYRSVASWYLWREVDGNNDAWV